MKIRTLFFGAMSLSVIGFSSLATAQNSVSPPRSATPDFPSGNAALDVSDRQYLVQLRELIGFAQKRIDASLTQIAVRDEQKDVVGLLLQDLVDAVKRGVKVRLFLGTDGAWDESIFLREDKLAFLKKMGVDVQFVNPKYRLSDQVIVVDEDKVLEGGPLWTNQDLTEGLGSASLNFSSSLALKKRTRMEFLPLWNLKVEKEARTVGEIAVPLFLLQDVKYFPAMVNTEDGDAMKVYLFLLDKFYSIHQASFQIVLEEVGQNVPSDRTLNRSALVHQSYETLHRLATQYELITIKNENPAQLEISLKLPDQLAPNIHIPVTFFHENYVKDLSARGIYAYFVIRWRLQSSGESPVWIGSERNVEQDFPMVKEQFRVAVEELRRQNLIEVFPFNLRQGSGYAGPDVLEYRYLVNDILSLSERLDFWSRLRDQFGEQDFKRARDLSEALGEPEDPKVIATYAKLLNQYTYTDLQSLTQHVASLPPTSTPNQLSYLQQLLRNETQGMQGLGTN